MCLALLALPLTACGGGTINSAGAVAAASDKIAEAEARYQAAKAFADMLTPFLSPERAALVRAIETRIEHALFVAKTAATVAEQLAALNQVKAETAKLDDPG